ncbi:cell wall-binding repeat-containing protein [Guptibacillus hwajinpoensis]|uniref:cell wall-binding repeat-containing protein n=1 Tax=Guptibacillus hwajinpoensis TaxID=208199 RepID=UPI001CD641E5|nr:cell wall-binding repeat-containing protein [Pseudalkalibacillus hwajinpoensis]MCA0991595.1 cell wall-binding repeat-containing protein [Pseudalkalibacillus hwajinpoensis]
MTFKKKFITVFAGATLLASSFSNVGYNPDVAEAALQETKKFKPAISQEISALAFSDAAVQELIVVTKGKKDLSSQLEKMGVKVLDNHKNYVYLTEIPTNKVMEVYGLDDVASLGKNGTVELEKTFDDPEIAPINEAAEEVVGPQTEETHDATGVDEFHNKYDGSGTRVAIIDSGPDPGHEAFTEKLAEGYFGKSKIVGVHDYTIGDQTNERDSDFPLAEGDVIFDNTVDEGDSFTVGEDTYKTNGIDASDDEYHFGFLAPDLNSGDLNADGEMTEDHDEDVEGNDADKFGVLMVDDKVYIDKDNDMDFADEIPYANNQAGTFDVNVEDELVGANFRINSLDSENPFVNIFFDVNGHGTHVSGITAANGPARSNETGAVAKDGVAPGAELVGLKVFKAEGGAASYSIMSAMVDAALPESLGGYDADVVNMSLGSLPDLNDGTDADDELADLLSEEFGTMFAMSAGNEGPGADSVGSPGTSTASISVGAHMDEEMWATEYDAYPFGKNADGTPKEGDGLWYFSSNGPREDGMQKPDIVAPGASFASYPAQLGNYAVLQGTSMSAPYVAGALALLKQATEKDRVPFDYESAREALIQTAQPLEGYERSQQGAGLIDIPAAYEYLKNNFINDVKEVNVQVYHGEKVSGGPGLYVRNQEIPEKVEVLIENPTDETKELTIKPSESWFTPSKKAITLKAGQSEKITVTYDKDQLQVGRNEGTLVIDDKATAYVEARSYQTIIVGEEFTSENKYRFSDQGEVQSSKTEHYYFDVKPGMEEIRFALSALQENGEYQGRVRMLVHDPDGKQVSEYQGYAGYGPKASSLKVEENVFESPKAGVWEVAVYGTIAPEEGKEVNKFNFEAFVQGVVATPGEVDLGSVAPGTKTTKEVKFENYLSGAKKVKIETGDFSKAESSKSRIEVPNKDYYLEELKLENNISLEVATSNPKDPGDDVDLEFYKKTKDGYVPVASSGDASSDEKVNMKALEDGTYLVAVFGYSSSDGKATEVDLTITEERVLNPGEEGLGELSATNKTFDLGIGKSLKTDVKITTPDASGDYTAGVFLKDAVTDEVLSILPVSVDGGVVDVIKGSDREATAIEVSKEMYPDGFTEEDSKTVVITTGYDFPDALSAGPLASAYEAPVLLAGPKGKLSEKVRLEISRLGAENAVIVGGTGVVSDDVLLQLAELGISTKNVERLSGKSRFDTNLAIVNHLQEKNGYVGKGVFLATGMNYADALSAAGIAGEKQMPIVLTDGKKLSKEAKEILKGEAVYVLGGTGAISDTVYNEVESIAFDTMRLKGKNRYGTLAAIQEEFADATDTLYVASGQTFPDALSSAPLVSMNKGTLVLVQKDDVPTEVESFLTKYLYTNDIKSVKVLGGNGAVSEVAKDELQKLVK